MAFDASFNPIAELGPVASPRERLVILRNFIAALPDERFDMSTWHQRKDCGTCACIGGWAAVLFGLNDVGGGPTISPAEVAEYLGLSVPNAFRLFYPPVTIHRWGKALKPYKATHKEAVKVIDHYLATGEVSWSAAYA